MVFFHLKIDSVSISHEDVIIWITLALMNFMCLQLSSYLMNVAKHLNDYACETILWYFSRLSTVQKAMDQGILIACTSVMFP